MRNVNTILTELSQGWENYTQVQKNAIASAVAGVRQYENFIVLMNNFGKAQDYAGIATESAGIAMEKFGGYTEGIEATMNELKTTVEEVALKFIDSETIITIMETLSSVVGFLADNVWILEGAVRALLLLGVVKGIQLVGNSFKTLILRANNFTTATIGMQGAIKGVTAGTFNATTATNIFNQAMAMLGMTTSGVTTKEAIRQLKMTGLWGTIKKLDFATQQQILTMMGYDAQVIKEILKTDTWSMANITLSGTFKGLGAAIKGMMATNPIGWIMLAISAIIELTMWLGTLNDETDELAENQDLETLTENLKNAKSEAEEAAEALNANLKAIEALQSKETLTYVEDKELEKLKQATQELRWQQEIKEQKHKKTATDFILNFDKTYGNEFDMMEPMKGKIRTVLDLIELTNKEYEDLADSDGTTDVTAEEAYEIDKEKFKAYIEGQEGASKVAITTVSRLYNHAKQELEQLYENGAPESEIEAKEKEIAQYSSHMREELGSMQEYINYINTLSETEKIELLGSDWEDDLLKATNIRDMLMKTLDPQAYEKLKFSEFLDLEGLEKIKAIVSDLGFEGGLTADILKEKLGKQGYEDLEKKIKSAGLSIETFISWLNSQTNVTEKTSQSISAIKEEIEGLKDVYSTLSDSIEEYNNQGYFTFETMEKILDLGLEYIGYLIDENGNIRKNTNALEDYLRMKLQEQAYLKALEYVKSFTNKTDAEAIKIIQGKTLATEGVIRADIELLMTEVALLPVSYELREQILQQSLAMIEYAGNISFASDSAKDAKDATEEWEKVLNYANTILDEQIEKLEKEQEALEKLTEEKIKAHEAEIKRLEEEKELLEEKNDEKNKEIELEKLKTNLQKAKQRTMRVYYADKGWVWEQDPEAIQEAQQELDDFYTEQKIDNINKQIEAEEEKIDDLEESLDKELKTYEERIKAIKKYKDEWNNVKTAHEKAQDEIEFKAKLGAKAEKEILMGKDGRLKVLDDFKVGYTKALEEVAKKTESSAKRINSAFGGLNFEKIKQDLGKTASLEYYFGTTDEETSYAVAGQLKKTKGFFSGEEFYYDPERGVYYKGSDLKDIINSSKGISSFVIPAGTHMYTNAYASGTLSAKTGLANVDEKGNELIVPKQGRYRMMEYGDTVVPHNLSQRLFDVASNPLRFIANALNSVKTPNLMSNSSRISNASTINIGTIELPSVTNGESFIKQLQLIAANR